jgi:transcriptional regulator with GAF, ATPase, and Fis domain
VAGMVVNARDITERRRAEEELRRSEAFLTEGERLSHTGSWAWRPVILSTGAVLDGPLPKSTSTLDGSKEPKLSAPVTLEDAERSHIVQTLLQTEGVVGGPNGAAARLGLPRTTLIAKMRRAWELVLLKGHHRRREQQRRWHNPDQP